MEADDLLCSRNARSRTPLVGRAQWKINQPPSLERKRASLEGAYISFDARSKEQSVYSLWESSGTRRPSLGLMARLGVLVGGRVRKSRAIEDRLGHPLREI
jgi:hypothetical protein